MDDLFADPIEAYCVRCRTSVEMEDAVAVWTRRGQPATRGVCPLCGGVVFRMGKAHLHDSHRQPDALHSGDADRRGRIRLARDTVYINYATDDEEEAQQIAADLQKSGIAVWMHEGDTHTDTASSLHPALQACARMVVVHSQSAQQDATVHHAWQFFRLARKPIVLAEVMAAEVPDALRRSPRFVMSQQYKASLRYLLDALSQ